MSDRLWTKALEGVAKRHLSGTLQADTVIVGGGITGLTTAYLLAKAGKKPVVLEMAGNIGQGETGSTTALATMVTDDDLLTLQARFGDDVTKRVWESGRYALDLLEKIITDEGIQCEFKRCPIRTFAITAGDSEGLQKQVTLAKSYGFDATWHEEGLSFEKFGAMEIPRQAKFHPGKLLAGLAESIVRLGGSIYVDANVTGFSGKHGTTAVTAGGSVEADDVVIATHCPMDDKVEVPTRMNGYQSYVIVAEVKHGTIPEGMYLDTAAPYRYFRVDAENGTDRIILGGEDHKTGDKPETDPYEALQKYLRFLIGEVPFKITHQWSGQVFETSDGLPFIGPSLFNRRHHIAAGFAGNGTTFGPLAASIITDEILGRKNPYAATYSPARVRGLARLMSFGAATVQNYFGDRTRAKKAGHLQLSPGEGRVETIDGKPVAIHCAKDGSIIGVTAVCTHLGCIVRWNGLEQTWDCPCHGSRFQATGEVKNGPARTPLARIPEVGKNN